MVLVSSELLFLRLVVASIYVLQLRLWGELLRLLSKRWPKATSCAHLEHAVSRRHRTASFRTIILLIQACEWSLWDLVVLCLLTVRSTIGLVALILVYEFLSQWELLVCFFSYDLGLRLYLQLIRCSALLDVIICHWLVHLPRDIIHILSISIIQMKLRPEQATG